MNEKTTIRNVSSKQYNKRICLILFASVFAATILGLVIAKQRQNHHGELCLSDSVERQEYAVLAPTNATLTHYAVMEGDRVKASALVAIMVAPEYCRLVQNAEEKLFQAQLELDRQRTALIRDRPTISTQSKRRILQSITRRRELKEALKEQKNVVRELELELSTLKDELFGSKAQAFNRTRDNRRINSIQQNIALIQGKLDIARSDLKKITNKQSKLDLQSQLEISSDTPIYLKRALQVAVDDVNQKKAVLEKLTEEEGIHAMPILAPFSGVVTKKVIQEGSYARRGQPILVILKQDRQ